MGTTILMKCGHTALAKRQDGTPVCPICVGLVPGAEEVLEVIPDLTGREAICGSCNIKVPSDIKLPFFGWRPKQEFDSYYCGCRGWD